jgi:hypothetical protein
VLDLLVHRPDLPLYDNSAKVGLGLWNAPAIELPLEALILLGGMWLYLRDNSTHAKRTYVFGVVLVVLQVVSFFSPPPPTVTAVAWTAIVSYIAFALVIWWLEDRTSSTRTT